MKNYEIEKRAEKFVRIRKMSKNTINFEKICLNNQLNLSKIVGKLFDI